MKKIWLQLTGLASAALIFATSFVYAAGNVSETAALDSDSTEGTKATVSAGVETVSVHPQGESSAEDQQSASKTADTSIAFPEQVYVDPPTPRILSAEEAPPPEPTEPQFTEPPTPPVVEASVENKVIEQDLSGTTTLETRPTDAAGPPIDDTPDQSTEEVSEEPASEESSSEEESSELSSETSSEDSGSSEVSSSEPTTSEPVSSDSSNTTPAQPSGGELETALSIGAYTPYGRTLSIKLNGTTYKADAVAVVAAMLQSEMVGSGWDAGYTEAYKAQAIACHSYVKNNNNKGLIPSVYARTPSANTLRLVESIIGQMVYYNGAVAETVYCAASGLYTQGNQDYWGGSAIAYLQTVPSKYDEYPDTKVFTVDQMRTRLQSNGYDTSADPSTWFSGASYNSSGFVTSITICGQRKSGMSLHYLLNLRSSKAQIFFDGSAFTFQTNGFGHGVGMSQQGAMGYSKYEGWNYVQILNHYYPGTSVG